MLELEIIKLLKTVSSQLERVMNHQDDLKNRIDELNKELKNYQKYTTKLEDTLEHKELQTSYLN